MRLRRFSPLILAVVAGCAPHGKPIAHPPTPSVNHPATAPAPVVNPATPNTSTAPAPTAPEFTDPGIRTAPVTQPLTQPSTPVTQPSAPRAIPRNPVLTTMPTTTMPVAAHATTQPIDEPTTKASTQPVTQPSANMSTQPASQPTTNASAQPMTQPATQASTMPATQPATMASTQPVGSQSHPISGPAVSAAPPTPFTGPGEITPEDLDPAPHPRLSAPRGRWTTWMGLSILGLFVLAGLVGKIVQALAPEEVPPSHSHDEPPGSSGRHGRSGTMDSRQSSGRGRG